jgi:eukaryotic-like serine/threonine-protein kinase
MASGSDSPGGQRTSDGPPRPSLDGRETLGKYQIVRQLGAGGMGTVYLAVDSQLKRTVALKVLPKERTENETLIRRFEAEAQAAAQLKHENIVTVYDAGNIDGHLFIALELVEGTDIHELVSKRGPLPLKRSVNFVKQIAHALEHLHKRGFVHRDIKPSNILVTREGQAKLTDMGLARAVDESLESNITREGTTVGTVDYMAPEQARDSQSADIRSDIYSLGCTWYQMITGEPPFPTGSVTNKLYSHISKPRPDPRALNRSIPEEVVAILHRMMARKADDRYQTPTELLEDIANMGSSNKRIDELLDGDDESPGETATPMYGAPTPLPARQVPHRSAPQARHAESEPASDPTPHPERRLPARRGQPAQDDSSPGSRRAQTVPPVTPPPQRMPARQGKNTSDPTPLSSRSTARSIPEPTRDVTPRSGIRTRASNFVDEEPDTQARAPRRGNEAPASHSAPNQSASNQSAPGQRRMPARRQRAVDEEPVQGAAAEGSGISVDWKSLGVKGGAVAGGILILGVCVWLGVSWKGSGSGRHDGNSAATPFGPAANQLPAEVEKDTDEAPKADAKTAAKTDPKGLKKNPGLLVDLKKAAESKATDALVLGRPDERQDFPSWISELWNPTAVPAKGAPALATITVGRVGSDRATAPSLAAAIESLSPQGGLIELRGRGPFLLPASKIANRGRVVIAAASARNAVAGVPPDAASAEKNATNEQGPVIVLVPVPGTATESGLAAIETSLTLYGVNIVAFADQFPGDSALRLVEARSADLILQKCSFTLVGSRNGSTIACSVSNVASESAPVRPVRMLVDRTLIRGKDCAALEVDLPSVDLLAINSLFVTGKAPAISLTTGSGHAPQAAKATGVARNLRVFSCTTCTNDAAISLRLGPGAPPPGTQFHVLNSVFGASFDPPGPAMIGLGDWPVRPLGANNRLAFENLTWMTDSFVARGWQNLVRSDKNSLGTKDASKWAAYWGEPKATIDDEPASFPNVTDFAAVEPAQFKWEEAAGRQRTASGASPAGCDVSLLAAASSDAIGRASAFSTLPALPPALAKLAAETSNVREINLDNPNRRDFENLAKYINRNDWKSGMRFVVRGTGKKVCGPIHVTKRSLTIEFADPAPLLTFEEGTKNEVRDSAFISVNGASLQIVNANFRVGSTAKRSPHWLLDVKDGNFSIRESTISGPAFDKPGYEGLIHFASTHSAGESKANMLAGEIRNSLLCTSKVALSGDMVARNLILENAVLAANTRVFDLRVPIAAANVSMIDLASCTLAAGEEYFHFEMLPGSGAASKPAPSVRIIADGTVFGPPVQSDGKSEERKPLLISGVPPESIASVVEWWEYACAYSNLIGLPNAGGSRSRREPLAEWKQIAGAGHIVRPLAGPNAVLLPRDLPAAKELGQGDFTLKSVAEAKTWSDTGTPIGAILAARSPVPTAASPPPKSKSSTARKASSGSKAPSKSQPSGI